MSALCYTVSIMKNNNTLYIPTLDSEVAPILAEMDNTLYIPTLGRSLDLRSIVIDGVDITDAFDFCDAFVSEALWTDGSHLGNDELETIMDNSDVQQIVMKKAYNFCGF